MSPPIRVASRYCQCLCQSPLRRVRPSIITPTAHQPLRMQWRRHQTTEADSAAVNNSKISSIVDQISQLTLLETAELVSSLKSRLNIPDLPIGGFAAGAAAPAAPAPVEEEEAAPKAEEKTLFNLTLKSFDAAAKPKVIKEIKSQLGLSLVDSKKFVESAPKLMKENVAKDEAEKLIETMKGLGAEVTME